MAQYRVLEKSYINNSIVEEGAIVEYDGEPSANLELVGDGKAKPHKGNGKKGVAAPVSDEQANDEQAGDGE